MTPDATTDTSPTFVILMLDEIESGHQLIQGCPIQPTQTNSEITFAVRDFATKF